MSQAGIASGGSGGAGKGIQSLTGNSGGSVGPDGSNNINVIGETLYTVRGVAGTNTLFIDPLVNAYPITPYVVGPVGAAGYQTIQSAVNAANLAGGGIVGVQPGNYTENLTLFNGVHITGITFADAGGGVNITGVHTPPTTGGFVFNNVKLISATNVFSSAAAGSAHLVIANAQIAVTNGYTFNLPNWTGKLESFDVNAAVGTNDGYVNNSGGSEVDIFECSVGSGTVNSMIVSGFTLGAGANIYCPVNFTSTATGTFDYSDFNQNVTFSNSSSGEFSSCRIATGNSQAITMNSSSNWTITSSTIATTNNPAVGGTGTGILTYEDIIFTNNANFAGTLTLGTVSWQPYSRAIAATDGTKVGTCAFNNAQFTVDANGFVSLSSSGPALTITGDSGGALSPVANNWNIFGGPGVTTSGAGNTLTINSVVFTDQGGSISVTQDSGSYVTAAITLTTPAAPAQGHELIFACTNASTLVIKAAGAQLIRIGSLITSVGGTMTSTSIGDSVTLRFRTADSTWYAVSVIGTWTKA